MFDGFMRAMDGLGRFIKDANVLMYIAVGLFCAILAFQLTFLILYRKKIKINPQGCCCGHNQAQLVRRRCVLIVAWIYAVFAALVLTYGSLLGEVTFASLMLPAVFLFLIYVLEAFFGIFYLTKCNCCGEGVSQPSLPKEKGREKETADRDAHDHTTEIQELRELKKKEND